ncbi:prefoldin subunit 5-like [Trichosurus vulpecula]|uniref:prefoldin subunit 5-like n=1 Tax=Trichosurus vulpecula TaxID=9337 RepID=UPI00186B30A1|nr:prefoldin subunit 5-like [Trichosurus vulpecula]
MELHTGLKTCFLRHQSSLHNVTLVWTSFCEESVSFLERKIEVQRSALTAQKKTRCGVNITELLLPQLELLKNQLDQEVEFLSSSIAHLKVVQTKYVEAKECLNVLNKSNEGKELLVPLTSSMYVPGKLHDVEHVLIDVGTGYYVEKSADDAKDFFKRKIDFLTKQMEKIQPTLQEKHAMKQAIMEMMNQKIQQLTALGASQVAVAKPEGGRGRGTEAGGAGNEPRARVQSQ